MKVLLLIAITFGMIGCTKDKAKDVLCSTGKAAASLIAAQVAVQLDCKNVGAIQTELESKLVDLKICSPTPAGAVGEVVCKPIIDALLAGVLTQVPASWECSGGQLGEDAKAKLLESCLKAL
jgi:hypothetical protein